MWTDSRSGRRWEGIDGRPEAAALKVGEVGDAVDGDPVPSLLVGAERHGVGGARAVRHHASSGCPDAGVSDEGAWRGDGIARVERGARGQYIVRDGCYVDPSHAHSIVINFENVIAYGKGWSMATADVLLHPVRMRILQSLFDADPLTTTQLRERLPDIAPATMYRHIAVLTEAGVLEVVDERRVRGAVERSYRVREEEAVVDPAARAAMTREDHRRAYTTFAASLMSDFDRYLAHEDANPTADGVVYRQAAVWLTEEEFAALVEEIETAVLTRVGRARDDGRIRRIISLVVVPDEPRKDRPGATGHGPTG
ncbi:helix-turn-helix domain-containing protein [Streptomyces sp. NPDC101455]|uniref:helix-turn-helix domain-containing protein n=1 Tax=Streptomyces sp. NPDC101455 TaxID=3366142 RepID=UPI0038104E87